MENREFYIQYLDNQPVPIDTHFIGENNRRRPLSTVGHLVAACTVEQTRRLLGLPEDYGPLTLHLPEGIDRDAFAEEYHSVIENFSGGIDRGALAEECFSSNDSQIKVTITVRFRIRVRV